MISLQWRHNERGGVTNHRRLDCLLNRLFRRRSKITSKFRVTSLCKGNSPVTVEFPAQRASDAENVTIWWRHHIKSCHQNSRSLEATRLGVEFVISLWNLPVASAAQLPRRLPNLSAIGQFKTHISRLRYFTRFGDKTSYFYTICPQTLWTNTS